MQSNEKKLDIIQFDFKQLPAYAGAEDRQRQIVKENPFLPVENNNDFAEAKKRRMALRKGRYDLQEGERIITKHLNEFKKDVKDTTLKLIEITKVHEEKQDEEIKRYEEEKQAEKERKEQQEKERINKIRENISAYRTRISGNIKSMTLKSSEEVKQELDNVQLECEEFQQDFDHIRESLYEQFNEKKETLDKAEILRRKEEELEQQKQKEEDERKERERAESEKINRQNKLIELGLRFDGAQFIYKDVNFHWSEVIAMTGPQFAKQLAGAEARMEEIRKEEKAEEEKRANELKQLEEERKAMKAERESMRKSQLLSIGLTEDKKGNFCYGEKELGSIELEWNVVKELSPDEFLQQLNKAHQEIEAFKKRKVEAAQKAKKEAERKAKEDEEKRRKYAERKNENDWRVDAVENIGFNFDFEKGLFEFESVTVSQNEVFVQQGQEIDRNAFDNDILPQIQQIYNREVARIEALKPEKVRVIEALQQLQLPEIELEALKTIYSEIKADLNEIIENYKEQIQNY